MAPLQLYGAGSRALKVELVAAFAGVEIEMPSFIMGVTNKTPWFMEMNPNGKIPVLKTPSGAIFESNVISRYVASVGANGSFYPAPTSPAVSVGQTACWAGEQLV